jgi:hypothetical protein
MVGWLAGWFGRAKGNACCPCQKVNEPPVVDMTKGRIARQPVGSGSPQDPATSKVLSLCKFENDANEPSWRRPACLSACLSARPPAAAGCCLLPAPVLLLLLLPGHYYPPPPSPTPPARSLSLHPPTRPRLSRPPAPAGSLPFLPSSAWPLPPAFRVALSLVRLRPFRLPFGASPSSRLLRRAPRQRIPPSLQRTARPTAREPFDHQ